MPDFVRKRNRLEGYDYSQAGAYFITICTIDREHLFCEDDIRTLSPFGSIVDHAINRMEAFYPGISLEKYVVMPNHIHMIMILPDADHTPSISTIIGQLKGTVTKQTGRAVFQRSFHDHIIRDEKEYLRIWNYIDTNPENWQSDCFYS